MDDHAFDEFCYGDKVRLVQRPELTGQIIGNKDWGSEYLIRMSSDLSSHWFADCEIELFDAGPKPAITDESQDDSGNVIYFSKYQKKHSPWNEHPPQEGDVA